MSGLPQYFEPIRLAQRAEEIVGDLAVSQMPRLRQFLSDGSGTVHVSIACVRGELGAVLIRGNLSATLKAECQRCLGVFDLPLHVTIDACAAPDAGTEAGPVPEADVIMQGENNQVHLAGFVEDEMILALPLAPLHAAGQCPVAEYSGSDTGTRANPFAPLKKLKLGKD
ncbi:MAG: DUF177 domain-containing protein [Gammaproteobacteria bacterium]|nr:DUF177 domain-containing protein [Gammaproteobacteria bacterium]